MERLLGSYVLHPNHRVFGHVAVGVCGHQVSLQQSKGLAQGLAEGFTEGLCSTLRFFTPITVFFGLLRWGYAGIRRHLLLKDLVKGLVRRPVKGLMRLGVRGPAQPSESVLSLLSGRSTSCDRVCSSRSRPSRPLRR